MKLEIFNEQPKQKDVIRLKLVECCGKIYVDMVDEKGETLDSGSLIAFETDIFGYIRAHAVGYVNSSLPVRLTIEGSILVV